MATPMTAAQILDSFKAEGLTVREVDGWTRRCRCCPDSGPHHPAGPFIRGWGDVNGQVAHITAGNLNGRTVQQYIRDIINGDPELPTKSQTVIDPDGVVWVNSAGRCNHAGKVGSKVRDHMIAADFSTTDDYDSRWRGASADGNSFTYGDECIAASKMNAKQYDALVRVHAARARFHGWTGQESVGHGEISGARTKADPNLDMGEFRRDVMARLKAGVKPAPAPKPVPPVCTVPAPAPKPAPKPATVTVTTAVANLAGSNAHGIATAKSRIGLYVAARRATPVDAIAVQECTVASTVRPRMDSGLKPLGYRRAGGGEGRYVYTGSRLKIIHSGLITAPKSAWYKRDDKQCAWVAYEVDGARGMDLSFQAEYRDGATADDKRVEQVLYFAAQSLVIAAQIGVPEQNILLPGDTNSERMVLDALIDAGWRNVAAGTRFENMVTFLGWDGLARKRFDYGFVRSDALTAKLVAVGDDTKISDHAGLRIVRQLTK